MKLGEVIRVWRKMKDLSLREAGSEMGVATATLLRVERGELMDGKTLAKIITWLLQ